jgi:hypothetical protein
MRFGVAGMGNGKALMASWTMYFADWRIVATLRALTRQWSRSFALAGGADHGNRISHVRPYRSAVMAGS